MTGDTGAPADASLVVLTDRFGSLVVSHDDVIELPEGLVGFPEVVAVVAVPVNSDGLFWWLQSVHDPALAFLTMVPWAYFPDYEPELPTDAQDELGLTEAGDAAVYCLLTIHQDPHRFTANLLGPVVVNRQRRVGRQVVLTQDLPTRADLPTPG